MPFRRLTGFVFALALWTVAPAAAQPAAAPAVAPAPSRLTLRAEFRERLESASHVGFAPNRDDMFWLSRLRLTATARPLGGLTLTAQVQDSRVADKDIGATGPPFSAPFDLRIAQVEVRPAGAPASLTVGRQELAFGEQRLVGHVNWANAARTFDAVRLTMRRQGLQVDGFVSSVVRIRTDTWDRSGSGNQFHGLYVSSTRLIPRGMIEPYFFWRADRNLRTETGAPGHLGLGTFGIRLAGQLPRGLEYGLETVVQRGSLGTDTQRARAQHLRVRTPALQHGIRLISEYNYASGDRDSGDGTRETFDPLYPTPHDKYGLSDQVGWRNVHHVRAAVDMSPIPGLPVTAAYHSWWLATRNDALYNAPGAAVARVAAGAPRRHVGQGLDVQASRALSTRLQAAAGYAYVHPGGFLQVATPGASHHALYLMLTVAVTAEQRRHP